MAKSSASPRVSAPPACPPACPLSRAGTLTPIVSNPDLALMSEQAREAVRRVAQLFPTAVISGRGREKVQQFVRLGELYYAGSHGMDIVGPSPAAAAAAGCGGGGGDALEQQQQQQQQLQPPAAAAAADLAFQPAAAYGPLIDSVFAQLSAGVAGIAGSSVEHNKFCVSVHFRNCAPEDYPAGGWASWRGAGYVPQCGVGSRDSSQAFRLLPAAVCIVV